MKILVAADMGADGIEVVVWLDESKTVIGPDGDERPDPSWVWRTFAPRDTWEINRTLALAEVAARAEAEGRRRRPVEVLDLAGADLDAFLAVAPAPQETTPEDGD
jgi:hypothetical protein